MLKVSSWGSVAAPSGAAYWVSTVTCSDLVLMLKGRFCLVAIAPSAGVLRGLVAAPLLLLCRLLTLLALLLSARYQSD